MPLDIGIGLIGAILQSFWGYEDLTPQLLILGALFALLPDVDFLVSAIRKGSLLKVDHTHRDLLHHPVPYLAVGGALVWFLAPQYTLLFMGLSLAHFVHDSIGVGWGIPWLSPMSRRYAKFLTDRKNHFAWTPVMFWKKRERDALIAEHHDPDWLKHTYAKFTATSLVELAVFLLALCFAFYLSRIL